MLGYHKRKTDEAIESWISERKTGAKTYLSRNKKRIASLCILAVLCVAAFVYVIPSVNSGLFMPIEITPRSLNRLSEDAFRNIIGYGYEDKIYIKDTAEIRTRLENDSMIFGNVRFSVKLIPYELEVYFKEAGSLFALMPQSSGSKPIIYSDKGKIYSYSANVADLPVVDAKNQDDISLATDFLLNMRKNDVLLYSRISQLIPSNAERQITVFFNDVDFKTKFSLESDYWKTAFKHYRQLTRNMRALNIDSIAVLDLRFKQLAYTIKKEERL